MTYKQVYGRPTPQSEPLDETQVENSAGGFVYGVDKWTQLNRFLLIGTEGGTYYVKERQLTLDNAKTVLECIKEDGVRVVDTIVAISDAGRAPKNDPALFALAMCASFGTPQVKKYALDKLNAVARIGTHLFMFVDFVNDMRGWGRGLRTAVANWYNTRSPESLAYQMAKYQQRGGWEHRDVLRLAHVVPDNSKHDALFNWATQGNTEEVFGMVEGLEKAKVASTESEIITYIRNYGLTREMIPTQFLNSKDVWDALLTKMPMTAMIRNLGKMTSIGLVAPFSEASQHVVETLSNIDAIKKARVHPFNVYVALATYRQGSGVRGSLSWSPVPQVSEALEDAFYSAFETIEPTGKRFYLALDVSGSMSWNTMFPGVTPAVASALMAMVTARSEKNYLVKGFSSVMKDIGITAKDSLDAVVRRTERMTMGRTDCAQPMLDAIKNKIPVDTFVIYTDNETWFGSVHPMEALRKYRKVMDIPAKLLVVAMEANRFSIADPRDPLTLDIVGFDTATPQVISEFSK